MSGTNRQLQERGEALAQAAREARQEAAAGLAAQTGGFGGERLTQETTGAGWVMDQVLPGPLPAPAAAVQGPPPPERSCSRRPHAAPDSRSPMPNRYLISTLRLFAGPYGTYAKGGSETGMLGGMGAAAAPPAPGAKPDVSARLAQVICGGL